jgi:APA family basic amino acid/polyamine antiporter
MFLVPFNLQYTGINAFIALIFVAAVFLHVGILFAQTNNNSFLKFIEGQFGSKCGFFVAWFYWILSWSSTIIIVTEMFRYFINIFPYFKNYQSITQCTFVSFFIILNCFKTKLRNTIELSLNIIKLIPLIIIPFIALYSYKFSINKVIQNSSFNIHQCFTAIPKIVWCFFGIECGILQDKRSNMTQIITIAVGFVTFIYFINLLATYGVLGYTIQTPAVFSEIMQVLFGDIGNKLCSTFIFIVTMGALNVWIISSTSIAVEMSHMNYLPRALQKQNWTGENYIALLASSLGLLPLCLFSTNKILIDGLEMAANGLILFYCIFCLAHFRQKKSIISLLIGCGAIIFFLKYSSLMHWLIVTLILLLGLPFYSRINK